MADQYTEKEEEERLAIYEESKRRARLKQANYVDKEEKRLMIAEMELMLMQRPCQFDWRLIEIQMKSLTYDYLNK